MTEYKQGSMIQVDVDLEIPVWVNEDVVSFYVKIYNPFQLLYLTTNKLDRIEPKKYAFIFSVPINGELGTWNVEVETKINNIVSGIKKYEFVVVEGVPYQLSRELIHWPIKLELSKCGKEDVESITPKVFNKKKKRKLKELSFKQLEFYHALAHSKFGEIGDKACKLHFKVASEMIRRGAIHVRRSLCDGVVELIHSWRDYDPHGVDNAVLRDDWRIVKAWLHTLKSGTKFESKQFEGMTIEQQRKAVHHLGTIIRREMIKRGWKPKAVVAPK
jgi:hypothetical protein